MSFLLLTQTIQQSTKLDGGAEFYFDGVWVCICMYVYVFLRRKVSFNNQLNLDGRRDFYSLETECAGA